MTNRLLHELNLFLTAISFLTRLPVDQWLDYKEEYLHLSSRYFAWVGWVVGGSSALALAALSLCLPMSLAVLLAMVAGILITGAFHEDGFADCCDGFGGGWSAEQVLTIMKDSRLGTYGVMGLVIMLGIKFLSVLELGLISLGHSCAALLTAHVASRWLATSLLIDMNYVQDIDKSKSKPLATRMKPEDLLFSAVALIPIGLLLDGLLLLALIINLIIVRQSCKIYFNRRISGYTGDCLGATQQLAEITCYLSFLMLMPQP